MPIAKAERNVRIVNPASNAFRIRIAMAASAPNRTYASSAKSMPIADRLLRELASIIVVSVVAPIKTAKTAAVEVVKTAFVSDFSQVKVLHTASHLLYRNCFSCQVINVSSK